MLDKTSRSFAAVINALDTNFRDCVCVFYLTLRALASVEDDPAYPKEKKIPMLQNFYKHLKEESWALENCGEKPHEKELLTNFPILLRFYHSLSLPYQQTISQITLEMGTGMSSFIGRKIHSLSDYNLYCHYVAGLVGVGLSRLFADSGLEDHSFFSADRILSNSMGLLLQKTNIIRDYLEDVNDGREFWPKEIVEKYVKELKMFKEEEKKKLALECLNELITNALEHVNDNLEYMAKLKDPPIFNFCAIPQIMAIATLEACYNNYEVFKGVVKIRREVTEDILSNINGMESVYKWFKMFAIEIKDKVEDSDPHASKTKQICDSIQKEIVALQEKKK